MDRSTVARELLRVASILAYDFSYDPVDEKEFDKIVAGFDDLVEGALDDDRSYKSADRRVLDVRYTYNYPEPQTMESPRVDEGFDELYIGESAASVFWFKWKFNDFTEELNRLLGRKLDLRKDGLLLMKALRKGASRSSMRFQLEAETDYGRLPIEGNAKSAKVQGQYIMIGFDKIEIPDNDDAVGQYERAIAED